MNNSLLNNDCPPLMSDGRNFTDYRPSCHVHDLILKQNNVSNSYDLKMLMINQAEKLREINKEYYQKKNSCMSCNGYYLPDPNGHIDYWSTYSDSL
jgi:hypothetical protein